MINEDIWKKLEGLYMQIPGMKCSNATDEQIQEAQEAIRAMLSDFYRYYLKHHAVNRIGDWMMYNLDSLANGSMVDKTLAFRRNMNIAPEYRKWHLIGGNDKGTLLLMNNRSEVWALNLSGSFVEADKVAENFEQFLEDQIEQVYKK